MNTKIATFAVATITAALFITGCSTAETPAPVATSTPVVTDTATPAVTETPAEVETPVEVDVVEAPVAPELKNGETVPADKVAEYKEAAKGKKGTAIITLPNGEAVVIVKGEKPSKKVVKALNDVVEATGARENAKSGTATEWGAKNSAATADLMPLHSQGIEFVTVLTAADIDGNEVLRSYFYVTGSGAAAAELKGTAHMSSTYAGALAHAEQLAAKYPGTIVIK